MQNQSGFVQLLCYPRVPGEDEQSISLPSSRHLMQRPLYSLLCSLSTLLCLVTCDKQGVVTEEDISYAKSSAGMKLKSKGQKMLGC